MLKNQESFNMEAFLRTIQEKGRGKSWEVLLRLIQGAFIYEASWRQNLFSKMEKDRPECKISCQSCSTLRLRAAFWLTLVNLQYSSA